MTQTQTHTPTPGPWKFVPMGSEGGNVYPDRERVIETLRERSQIIAYVPDPTSGNGPLIAAAPETAAERDRLRETLIDLKERMEKRPQIGEWHHLIVAALAGAGTEGE